MINWYFFFLVYLFPMYEQADGESDYAQSPTGSFCNYIFSFCKIHEFTVRNDRI